MKSTHCKCHQYCPLYKAAEKGLAQLLGVDTLASYADGTFPALAASMLLVLAAAAAVGSCCCC